MNNEAYYDKTIKILQEQNKNLQEQNKIILSNNDSLCKNLLREKSLKSSAEEERDTLKNNVKDTLQWLKIMFWILVSVFIVLLLTFKAYSDKSDELVRLQEQKSVLGPTQKALLAADSIFSGAYCLYPTDTAVMYSANGYGDTLKLMITNKH